MEQKYLIGSKLLGLTNNHDTDYLVLQDDDDSMDYRRSYENGVETHYKLSSMLQKAFNFELPFDDESIRYYIVNYQLDENIIGQNFPYKFSVLAKRDKHIEMLNWVVDNRAVNFVKNKALNRGNCSKLIYHIAYMVFMLENNSTVLTAEQKAIVQRIHDKKMPQDYLDVLAEKIRNLK